MNKYNVRWYTQPPAGDDMLTLGIDGVKRVYSRRPLRMGVILPPKALPFERRSIWGWLNERGIHPVIDHDDPRRCTAIIEDDDIASEFRIRFA